ncbi:uncharacterized protein [Littorina saxatilis]|uniref:uncharacterized protein n=1 Tax=Littorina saxatilis TaxID=31220 RepID=UPI0038B66002
MCSKRCGHCLHDANCHHATGFCLKCEPGWNGTTCQNGGRANFTGTLQTPVVLGKRGPLIVGDNAELTCSSVDTRGATYHWYADGSLIRDITSKFYNLYPVTLKDNGREVSCTVTVGLITSDPSTDTVTLDVKSKRIRLMVDDVAPQVIRTLEEGNYTMTCLASGVHSEVINMDMAVMLDNLTLTDCVRTPGDLNKLPCNITRISVRWDCPVQLNRTGHTMTAQCVDLGDRVSNAHAALSVFAYQTHSRLHCPRDWQAGQWITLTCVISLVKTTDPNVAKSCLQTLAPVKLFFWQKATSANDNSTAYDPQCSVDTSRCNFTSVSRGCGCTIQEANGASVSMYTFVTNTRFNGWWRCGISMSCLADDINSTGHSSVNCDERIAHYQLKEKEVDDRTLLWIFLGLFGAIGLLCTLSLCCNYHHHKHTCPGCCFAYQVDKLDDDDKITQGWDGYLLSIKRRWKRRDSPSKLEVFARKFFYYLGCLLPVSGAMFIASGGEMCSQHWVPCGKDNEPPKEAEKLKKWAPKAEAVVPWKLNVTDASSLTSLHSQPTGHVRWSEQVRFALDEEKSDQAQQKDEGNAGAKQYADKAGQHANDPDSEAQGGEERLDGADNEHTAQQQGDEQSIFD